MDNQEDSQALKALVVDKHSLVRQIVRGVLSNYDFTTILEATNYDSATKLLPEGPFDIIFTDINYDGYLEGYKLIEKIRDQKSGSDVPILVLTGESDKNHIIKSIHLGANDYILKPFVESDVDDKIRIIFETLAKPNSAYQRSLNVEKDIANGKLNQAEVKINKLITDYPKSFKISYIKALLLYKQKKVVQSIEVLEEIIENNPNFLKAYRLLADIYLETNKPQEAIKTLQKELEINPKQSLRQVRLGNLLRKYGYYREAIEHYRLSLIEDNKYEEALLGMGFAYGKSGNIEKSIYYLKRMRRINPNSKKSLAAIISICNETKKPDLAINALKEEAKIRPNYKDIHIVLAKQLFELDRDAEAIKVLQNAIKKIPDQTAAHRLLVNYHLTKKNTNAAMDVVNDSLDQIKSGNIIFLKAELLIKTKKTNEALDLMYDNIELLKDQKPKALELLAQAMSNTKQHGKLYYLHIVLLKEIAKSSTINKKKLQTKATRHKSSFVTRRQTRRISVAS